MIKKIIGVIVFLLAVFILVLSIQLIAVSYENGWYTLFIALFIGLLGVVIYRTGVRGVISALDDATPRGLK